MAEPDNRVTITAKLTPGIDDDLIRAWNAIENGKRQAVIKSALRAVLLNQSPKPAPEQSTGETLDGVADEVRELLALQEYRANRERETVEALKTALDDVWNEHARMISVDLPNFIERTIHEAMRNVQLAAPAANGTPETLIDEQPRITSEEKLERKANLRKTKW